ncbi:MAG TPA: hypothetical protein VI483_02450 [Candidatus Paceibacterota bacterium]
MKAKLFTAKKEQKGFTLLLAALVASVVLSIGSAVFSIALKQVALSSVGRNSQFAFYAADTAAECALYWDLRHQAFATSTESDPLDSIGCDDERGTNAIDTTDLDEEADAATTRFEYEPNGECAKVSVEKTLDTITDGIVTVIHADGYSTTCEGIDTDPQALQRSVELHY